MSPPRTCTTFLLVAGSFFLLGLIFQVLLIKELHLQSAEQDILSNIENHLPFHLHSVGNSPLASSPGNGNGNGNGKVLLRSDQQRDDVLIADIKDEINRHQIRSMPVFPSPQSKQAVNGVTRDISPVVPAVQSYLQHSPPNTASASQLKHPNGSSRYYRDIIGEVPQIVQSWRNAQLDWHELLPKHMSTWERFGEKKGLRLLVSKEEQITDYLTRFTESGLADAYGQDHGPLLAYSGCNKLRSDCMIHSKDICQTNGLCMWNPLQQLCVDFQVDSPYGEQEPGAAPNGRVAQCGKGQLNRGIPKDQGVWGMKAGDRKCKVWVDQPAIVMGLDGESQSMFYHWIASWGNVKNEWENKLDRSRQSHFFMTGIVDTLLYGYFGMLTDFCWRRASQELQPIPDGVCFCNIRQKAISQGGDKTPRLIKEVVQTLQLQHVHPPPDRPKIGIISRRKKRFILNEFEMADIAMSYGFEVVLLPLETMTYYEQVREFRSLDVLVGLHGSALDNVLFLHPGSVMVQLLPWKNEHRATFQEKAAGSHVEYMEWQVQDLKQTVLHWDLFAQADTEKLNKVGKDEIMKLGQKKATSRETLMFWINQDIIVPEDEWRRLLLQSVEKSTAQARIGGSSSTHSWSTSSNQQSSSSMLRQNPAKLHRP